MSSNLPYKQAANVERRTWDKETYEARAKARIDAEKDASEDGGLRKNDPLSNKTDKPAEDTSNALNENSIKEEFQSAEAGAQCPLNSKRSFLKARRGKVDLESKVGKTEIINPDAAATSSTGTDATVSITDGVSKSVNGVGWHCKVCDCFLKDSLTYLDHINGRKHQRALGFSMRIAKSTTSEVVSKLDQLARYQQAKEAEDSLNEGKESEDANVNGFEDSVKKKDEEIEHRKADRKKRREERKKKMREEAKQEQIPPVEEDDEDIVGEEDVNPDMAALMGFSGFG
jgi:U4/U6.U5 tri-snRNP component SNU23